MFTAAAELAKLRWPAACMTLAMPCIAEPAAVPGEGVATPASASP